MSATGKRTGRAKRGLLMHIQTTGSTLPPIPEERCALSGKRNFATQAMADLLLDGWRAINSFDGHSYLCPCGFWHITSRADPPA